MKTKRRIPRYRKWWKTADSCCKCYERRLRNHTHSRSSSIVMSCHVTYSKKLARYQRKQGNWYH